MKVEVCPVCACYLNYDESLDKGQGSEHWCPECDYVKQDAIETKSIYKGLE